MNLLFTSTHAEGLRLATRYLARTEFVKLESEGKKLERRCEERPACAIWSLGRLGTRGGKDQAFGAMPLRPGLGRFDSGFESDL